MLKRLVALIVVAGCGGPELETASEPVFGTSPPTSSPSAPTAIGVTQSCLNAAPHAIYNLSRRSTITGVNFDQPASLEDRPGCEGRWIVELTGFAGRDIDMTVWGIDHRSYSPEQCETTVFIGETFGLRGSLLATNHRGVRHFLWQQAGAFCNHYSETGVSASSKDLNGDVLDKVRFVVEGRTIWSKARARISLYER